MKKLENKVSLITGAGAGMGKQIALLFAEQGSKIIATDISRLDELEKEVLSLGGEITTLKANMANEEDIEKMIDLAVETYGTLDILVNNAGIMDNFEPVGDASNELYEKIMKINVEGPFKAIRKALKLFLPKKEGVIVNIASLGGVEGARAGAVYTMSKHAIVGLTKNTGFIYAKEGIRCNAIAPGPTNTSISETIDNSKIPQLAKERVMPGLGLTSRNAEASELAKVALFLASDDSSFVNGEVLVADGGWSAY